jgi:hypothetical protein
MHKINCSGAVIVFKKKNPRLDIIKKIKKKKQWFKKYKFKKKLN